MAPEVGRGRDRRRQGEDAAAEGASSRTQRTRPQDNAKDYMLKAVKTYKGLTDNDAFRNYPKMDMALFYYGYTLQGGKYMKEARAVYDKLLKNYPNSKYVPEAHLAFADYYFEQQPARRRRGPLQEVLKFPKSHRVLVRDVQDGLDPSQPAALPGRARDVLPGRAGHEERQEAGGPQPRRRRRTSSARTPRSARPTRRSTRSSASTTSSRSTCCRSSPTSTWSRARATRRSTCTAS